MYDLSDHQKQVGVETLRDCCWTRSIQNLSSYWQQPYRQPEISPKCLSLLHYNIRHFYSNHPHLAQSYNNIGGVYSDMGDDARALSFFERALETARVKLFQQNITALREKL